MSLPSFLRLPKRPNPGHSSACAWRTLGILVAVVWGWAVAPAALAATGTCGPATGQGTGPVDFATYCWIDFTNYNDATARGADVPRLAGGFLACETGRRGRRSTSDQDLSPVNLRGQVGHLQRDLSSLTSREGSRVV